MLLSTIKWNSGFFFDTSRRINFRSNARIELFRGNTPEFRIAQSDASDNGRRKYYTPCLSRSDLNFLLSTVSAVYWKSWARMRRQSSQSARSAASNWSDKSEVESHLRFARVSWKISKFSPGAIFNIKQTYQEFLFLIFTINMI